MAVIPYADVLSVERLPIDAQDVVTRVRLVVAGTIAGPQEPRRVACETPDGAQRHFPRPITYEYTSDAHATYGCTRAFALPEGFNPFLEPTDESIPDPTASNFSDPANVRDGDIDTYAQTTSGATATLTYEISAATLRRVAGVKLRYATEDDGGINTTASQFSVARWDYDLGGNLNDTRVFVGYSYSLQDTEGYANPYDLYAINTHDARSDPVNRDGSVLEWQASLLFQVLLAGTTGVRVSEFYPLILNEDLLEDVARAQVRVPASLPRRVSVRGFVPPDREHTITGWPGGDLTASVAQQQYDLGRTWVDFEQPGSPVGLPAEAIESARASLARFRGEIQSAGYSVTMGERR